MHEYKLKRFGNIGEAIARKWLKQQGFYVLPASLIESGGAPMLEGWIRKTIAMDNLACRDGQSRWVEVKTKRRAPKYGKADQRRTGCNLRNYRAYMAGQAATGIPGYLMFLHVEEQDILLGSLDWISVDMQEFVGERARQCFRGEDMAFFNTGRFDKYHIDGGDLQLLTEHSLPPQIVYPWHKDAKPLPRFKQGFLF